MIYKREEYIEESAQSERFPVKHIETLTGIEDGQTRYVGQVTLGLQTPMGVQQIPVSFEIEATSVQEAFGKFDALAEEKIEEARKGVEEEFKRLRDEASSRIITPGEAGLPPGGTGMIDFQNLKQ